MVICDRITVKPDLMCGAPTIRGPRIPVATVVAMIAIGITVDDVRADLPDLEPEDARQALLYATKAVREGVVPLRPST